MKLNIFRRDRHARWQQQLDAYVDGELTRDQSAAFERHSAVCDLCAEAVEQARLAKTALAALPQLQAPRSFAITEAMLAGSAPLRQTSPGRVYRLAQATAFAALAGFATLVVVDVTRDGSTVGSAAPAGLDSAIAESAPQDGGDEATSSSLAPPEGTIVPAADQATPAGGVGAAGTTSDYGAADTGGTSTDDAGDAEDGHRAAGVSGKDASSDDSGEPPSLALAQADEAEDGPGGLRVVQAALAALAMAMGATWFILRRRQRSMW